MHLTVYTGILQCDGYADYEKVGAPKMVRAGWPKVLISAKTCGSVFYDKWSPSIDRGTGRLRWNHVAMIFEE
jgi:hypothetical protein